MPVTRRLEIPDFQKLGKSIQEAVEALPDVVAISAINFFQDRFREKGWIGSGGFEPWEERKDPNGIGTLMNVTDFLKNAFDYETGKDWARVFNYAPYGSIHNEGGINVINVSKKMSKFFWAKFYETGNKKWKYMALLKGRQVRVKIPQRQFMGESEFFMKRIDLNLRKQFEGIEIKTFK